jgi:nitrite reductase/ring-hydroxylating ferredoxin subunit
MACVRKKKWGAFGMTHWIALGAPAALSTHRIAKRSVHGHDVAVWRQRDGTVRAVDNACPHRGASLADGGAVDAAREECVRCMYHGNLVRADRTVRVRDDMAWLLVPGASPSPTMLPLPPTCPEFSPESGLRTFAYVKKLPVAVNPVLMAENTIDWAHLSGDVHRVKFVTGEPEVSINGGGAETVGHAMATYAYETTTPYHLTIENEFWTPFTTSLRFRFRHKDSGVEAPPLLLWFSLEPSPAAGSRLHLRVARGVLASPAFDWVFRAIDELPLREDAWVVERMYPLSWSSNKLSADDTFISLYRDAMQRLHPELLSTYVVT